VPRLSTRRALGPEFHRVDLAERHVGGNFPCRVREMHRNREAARGAAGVRPMRHAVPQRITQVTLVRSRRRHRKNRRARTQEPNVTQDVLAVFRTYPDHVFFVA
jgi:hypothetical protein